MKTGIFRDELPGERKSIINTLLWGWMVVISILGFLAFYLGVQLAQVDRIIQVMVPGMGADQFMLLQQRLSHAVNRLSVEIVWIAILGGIFVVIGAVYTFNMIVRPLRRLVRYAEGEEVDPPEFKNNHEIKQLTTVLIARSGGPTESESLAGRTSAN
jgi:hypothetical protein